MANPPGLQYLKKIKIQNETIRIGVAEFFGTFILIIYGELGSATTILDGKDVPDQFASTWAWGVGVMLGIVVSGGISGGNINPGFTVAFASVGRIPWLRVPVYLGAQHLGAFCASIIAFFTYYDAFNAFDPQRTIAGKTKTAEIFSTYPNDDVSVFNCFFGELVGGGLVMFIVMAITDKKNTQIPTYLCPLFIGFTIHITAFTFGHNCMAPINPARDFAGRLFTLVAGWGVNTFNVRNSTYFLVGILGPHLGNIIGAWFYFIFIELHWSDEDEEQPRVDPLVMELRKALSHEKPAKDSSDAEAAKDE